MSTTDNASILSLDDINLDGKTVLIREDLNIPIRNGVITSDARLKAALPTIKFALNKGAGVIVCSHLGRPTEGQFEDKYSLAIVAKYLKNTLDCPVHFCQDYLNKGISVAAGELVLLENVRFNQGEKANDFTLAKCYANLCDVFVMNAFGSAHRAQASTEGVIRAIKQDNKIACIGNLLKAELNALSLVLDKPKSPVIAIVGGSKVSTKLDVLHALADICDGIIVGGGIANTFLAAQGYDVGASLYEADLADCAKQIMQKTQILLPSTVTVAKKSTIDFDNFLASLDKADATKKPINEIDSDEMILDMDTTPFDEALSNAKTILWNGPVGVFESDNFGNGTKQLANSIAQSAGFSVAGGGDTLAAIDKYGVGSQIDYMSTGGGAFLEFIEGKPLPAIVALSQ